MAASPSCRVLGLHLADGIGRGNMWACLSMAFAATMIISFVPAAQPYILGGVLGVAGADQGKAVGLLGVAAEITMIASLAWYGALADRLGRRPVVVAGFALCALGTALFPFATDTGVLVALRVVFALGVAALSAMLSTVVIDYVRDGSRGRSYGMIGLFSGLGAMVAVLGLVRLPKVFEDGGMTPAGAARVSFLVIAAALLAVAALMWFTLSGAGPAGAGDVSRLPLTRLVREGVRLARDPGVALSYAAVFVARADLAVVAGFLSLWVVDYATSERGMSAAEALARAGAVVGIAQTVAVVAAPLFGWLGDRMRRQDVVILAQAVAAVSYLSTLLVGDPLGTGMMLVAVLIGLGEIAGITTAGPLLAQQVPAAVRGSAYGVQTLCGAVGILIVSGLGGLLYDSWRPAAPFVVSGTLGLLVVAFGLAVRRLVTPLPEAPEDEAPEGSGGPQEDDPARTAARP
ncbi:MFS family permease [Streptosporangium becharense]|uniref:MFS family permease n=1 Tax=Streptosporangium becharense TaxID=1816182 RepID=A0A7W9MFJ6_9ACTN|nr:MFS transporter [Streptosporangium becharense]MBB2909913.1 MFS family permease [Streptosporangium becharense]MBB5819132.1 MFS family permease [Streptosporangium becharense]